MMITATRPAENDLRPARFPERHLLGPLVGTGVLMAGYLISRPYGDAAGADTPAAAQAFASIWWIVAHVCGALALASFGRLALRMHDLLGGFTSRLARTLALGGVVLVLPYYGMETFGLHQVGRAALAGDGAALSLVEPMRNHSVAMTMFGLGLVLLAVAAIAMALTWHRVRGGWAAWPLAVLMAGFLPQFFLPPTGRIAYGILYVIAAGVLLIDVLRRRR